MSRYYEILSVIGSDGVDYEKLLVLMFKDYEKLQSKGTIYSMKEFEPKGLIKLYYEITDKPHFEAFVENFKNRYIRYECQLEEAHAKCEREGLKLVYDYIQSFIEEKNINIYTICKLHQLLYSLAPYPEFGGKFRTRDVYLPGAFLETEMYDYIPDALQKLYLPTNELVKEGIKLGLEKDPDKIIDYIDKCIELNAELIRIHPFGDGNGRTSRAFMNLLFKLASIPPTYVKPSERDEYARAMNRAINEKDSDTLKKFYYYKICDSIYELDIKEKLNKTNENDEKKR